MPDDTDILSGSASIPSGGYESVSPPTTPYPDVLPEVETALADVPALSSHDVILNDPFAAVESGWTFATKDGAWTVTKPDGSTAQGKTVRDALNNFDLQRIPETAVDAEGKTYMTGRTLIVRPDGSVVS